MKPTRGAMQLARPRAALAIALSLTGVVIVRANNPCILFQPPTEYTAAGSNPKGIVCADFDLDGHLDLATACNGNSEDPVGEMGVNLGDGLGHFDNDMPFGTAPQLPWDVTAGDFDEDGLPDLAFTDGQHYSNKVQISLGSGTGEFTPSTTLAATAFPVGIVTADFDHDLHLDLAVVSNVGAQLTIFHGNGAGNFATAQQISVGMGTGLAVGDLNHDTYPDLVASHYNGASVFRNLGDGTFEYAGSAGSGVLTQAINLGDIDGDGNLDAVSALLYLNQVAVRMGNGDGTFGALQTFAAGSFPSDVIVHDLNRDGFADVAIVNLNPAYAVRIYLGSPTGLSSASHDFPIGPQPAVLTVGDFNEDAWPDLAVGLRNFGDTTMLEVMLQRPIGDLNCDGEVGFGDINPFVAYVTSCASWQTSFPGCPPENGDINANGQHACNGYPFDDINAFVALLSGGN